MAYIDASEWNRLAETASTPLMSHEWLRHLEDSGSIVPGAGWTPSHLTVHEGGDMVAALPLYVRTNSWGEFVFDFAFAEVAGELFGGEVKVERADSGRGGPLAARVHVPPGVELDALPTPVEA